MTSFVTGATGLIGRFLVERLLERDGDVHVLVRPESIAKLELLIDRWGGEGRVHPVLGDVSQPLLGLDAAQIAGLRGTIDHLFHLAAIYDMTAKEEANRVANVEGTRHAVALANALDVKHLHHASSIAVAGTYRGLFTEEMFDEGQPLSHPYHRSKYEAERIVRTEATVPWRVYRPSIVVGHSQTGETNKVDGPYYFFKLVQRMRMLPQWLPLVGPDLGFTNIVPVDYVAAAIDHIAHEPGLDGRAFHLASPYPQRSTDVMNTFAKAAGAPQLAVRVDGRVAQALPSAPLSLLRRIPGAREVRRGVLGELGIPDEVVDYIGLTVDFDTTETERVLEGTGIEVPDLETYAGNLWEYWERNLDPAALRNRSLEKAVGGRTVLITGASSGIGHAAAVKIARAGGIPLLVARSADKLEAVRREIEAFGGAAHVYTADLSDADSIDALADRVLAEHGHVDVLVNNAGRSIRRSVALSYDRFHDFERTIQLNYLGAVKLILKLLPEMRARRSGHVVNISTIGVQTNPPRFAAYVASKAALDAFTRVVASETIADRVTFTTIHMPLVRTPMIAPTKIYDAFPAISPDEAADLICDSIRSRPKVINTRLGTVGEVAYALAPKAVDQVLHLAYRVFPDSAAARGELDGGAERATSEQIALAHLTRGVHW
jgi:NAD(P)-dependent dehydrogenase (short-subunit alcohol dehydrogenase family)